MTRIQKRIRAVLILAAVIGLAALLCGGRGQNLRSERYVVEQGDTLWQIASEYKPAGMRYDDYIYLLQRENNIGAEIRAGQEIMIFTEE